MIALLFANWRLVLRASAVIAALALAAWLALALIDHGKLVERQSAVDRSARNADAADAAERDVLNCPPGRWNRGTGRCIQ